MSSCCPASPSQRGAFKLRTGSSRTRRCLPPCKGASGRRAISRGAALSTWRRQPTSPACTWASTASRPPTSPRSRTTRRSRSSRGQSSIRRMDCRRRRRTVLSTPSRPPSTRSCSSSTRFFASCSGASRPIAARCLSSCHTRLLHPRLRRCDANPLLDVSEVKLLDYEPETGGNNHCDGVFKSNRTFGKFIVKDVGGSFVLREFLF